MPHPPKSTPRPRLTGLIASLAMLPALAACGSSQPAAPPPASAVALEAIATSPGVDRQSLARAVDRLFTDQSLGETRAVVVMYGGRIVAERYADGYGPKTKFLGWSLAKTVTAVAIGMLVADGRLRLDESPPIPRWQRSGDPRGGITLRQLLQMRSGLRHEEQTRPEYDSATVRMLLLDGRDDMATWAEAQPLESAPGRKFEYSTPTGVILADIIARTLTRSTVPAQRQAVVAEFLHSQLFEPAGMHSMTPEFDAAGTMIGGAMIHANARDWARLGEFLRHGGSVRGAQVVPRRWIEFMRQPAPRSPDFGAQLWLNRASGEDRKVLFPERAPASLYGAVGHGGQYLLVSPEQALTVLRLGETVDEDRPALTAALADIVTLYPAG
jgi:CubicO group peptidase (beta-lactamase class C family)